MKILSPSCPNRNPFSGCSPPANFGNGNGNGNGFDGTTSPLMNFQAPQIGEQGCDKVHVALGKSVSKAVVLLQWTFQRFRIQEICILHVHQPSPTIPTLLGKLPASRANHEVVSAYRREEREEMKKLLLSYSSICCRLKVQASMITTEADEVQKGIVDLVNKHGIRKLVMEAAPENWMKAKNSSSKASYVAKNAPSSCEVWFVNKGKLVWTREASESSSFVLPNSQPESTAHILRSQSLHHHKSEEVFHPDGLRSSTTRSLSCAGTKNWDQAEAFQREVASSCLTSTSSGCGYSSSAQQMVSSDFGTTVEEESLYDQLAEVKIVAEASRNEVSAQILKRKNLEAKAVDAISKVKALESGHAHEVEHRKETEDALKSTIQEQERLLEERETITRELLQTMRHIAFLDSRAQEANRRREEASGELKLLQASIATLRREKHKIQRQKMEATRWLGRWRSQGQGPGASCSSGFIGFNEDSTRLVEFSLPDLQTATCDFSESFKIGQGPYGCVYKGEMFDRTVAIKKLHLHNMQGQLKLQQEVQVLGKLKHPHLVDLLGICPESWSLVYEYLPSGSLQDRLFQKSNIHPLNWKIRARIVAEFASALLFLHSSKPEKLVHGDLKPENILLESKLSCKISDFGIRRFLLGETLRCPSFRLYSEPNSAFPYTDPEFHRTGILTCKSDIYSFGLIVLQLLTGKAPAGLAIEVRKAVLWGKLSSVLDSSAGEWPTFIASRLVELGLQCCELNSRDRPELTPILVRELEQLHVLDERPVPSFFLCPILQEIMHDPQVAADGFTYEGEALRGWLENGRESSPMTNLKLSHLHLTPNHALRQAIQDWICRS